jgi:predicted dehydrogenase
MYRCHPQSRKLVELVRDGAIGLVHLIRAAFSYNAAYDEKTRYYANDKGGGWILDVGGYIDI